jgi:protein-S-isoprenylcysteine O-methyltransferase Ste14
MTTDFDHKISTKDILRRILQVFSFVIVVALLLFVSAGRINWIFAWLYLIATIAVIIVNASIMPTELIAERGKKKENVEKWDKFVTGLLIVPWLAIYLIAGLDMRYEWTSGISIWIRLAGIVIFFAGNALVTWSMLSNNYFSTAVRIQYERSHSVAHKGPYALVRHPGYLGMIIYNFVAPFILGSFWALIPAFLAALLFIIRTAMEDRTLIEKLDGYRGYAENVKYRLLPGVW